MRNCTNHRSLTLGCAGIGVGFWTEEEAFTDLKHGTEGTLFEPAIARTAADARHAKWKKAVERSLALCDLTDSCDGEDAQQQE